MEELFYVLVPQQIGGYKFENVLLMEQAFTRKSYSEENGGENNEVLEFIGDKVLDIAVIKYLAGKYGTNLHMYDKIPVGFRPEQEPTMKQKLWNSLKKMVEKKALARRIDELGFAQFLRMGQGDIAKNIAEEPSVKEDLFEAIIGAVALDSNWNFEKIQSVVEVMLCPDSFIENNEEADYVSLIYEWEDSKNGCLPWFKYFDFGPSARWYLREPNIIYQHVQGNLDHLKHACQLKLQNDMVHFEAYGESKNEARKEVCRLAYDYLKENDMLPTIQDEIDNPNFDDSINQLEILARRGYFELPKYEYEESHDNNGNPVWHVVCKIEERDDYFEGTSSSKKNAKKEAAFKMLNHILEHYDEEFIQ